MRKEVLIYAAITFVISIIIFSTGQVEEQKYHQKYDPPNLYVSISGEQNQRSLYTELEGIGHGLFSLATLMAIYGILAKKE
jgi:hypothetical protein